MSQRARKFVNYWIAEFLHPDLYEDDETLSESVENAADCCKCAAMYGIGKAEIDEEFDDLVAHIARIHEKILDVEMLRGTRRA